MGRDSSNILDLLIEHELVIKGLYDMFAERFTDQRHFWHNIASEEQTHADKLENLRSAPSLLGWLSSESRLKAEAIKSSISYIDSMIEKGKQGQFMSLQALSLARDIETALLERIFSKVSNSVPADIRVTLQDLAADTERHRKAISAVLEAERSRVKV